MPDVTSMDTRIFCRDEDNEPKYEVNFETRNRAFYEKVVTVCRECIDNKENIKENVFTEIKETASNKTFDIVDAFMHLTWGKKVRMVQWDKDVYIKVAENPLQNNEPQIFTQDGILFEAEHLFNKYSIESRWEDFKEEK